MIESLVSAWGAWPLFVGLAVVALTRVWQTVSASPELSKYAVVAWESVPSRVRPLIAILGAGVPAFGVALQGGASWAQAADAAALAWGAAAVGQETWRLLRGKAGAKASPPSGKASAVLFVLLVALALPACAALRGTTTTDALNAGLQAATVAPLACDALPDEMDREQCERVAKAVKAAAAVLAQQPVCPIKADTGAGGAGGARP